MGETDDAVRAHIDAVASPVRRRDAEALLALMARVTGESPHMWGPSIIGFGEYHYKYASGREGDAPAAGFAPRKAATTVYLPDGVSAYPEQLARLGDHSTGVGCLYLKDLGKIDLGVLEQIIDSSYRTAISGVYGNRARESGQAGQS